MKKVVEEIQAVSNLPLQIDSSNPEVLEKAMRIYNGKPLINSVNGKEESMNATFPLVKKYGGVLIALTLDEDGIPDSAEKRLEIARKIDTYETSILPYEDCCTVFLPKYPAIKPNLERVKRAEAKLDVDALIDEAFLHVEKYTF